MKVNGVDYRTIWLAEDGWAVEIIDQTKLPHAFETHRLETVEAAAVAIGDMLVRGAPLIGATAAYAMALAMRSDAADDNIPRAHDLLLATRPTAVNLRWALAEMTALLNPLPPQQRSAAAYVRAAEICDQDAAMVGRSISLPTAMPAGWRRSIGARRWRRSMSPMTAASICMSGSMKRARAIRALRSPPGNWPVTVCRIL